MDYVYLMSGWVIYFVLHSVLAAEGVKHWARNVFGRAFRFYRLIYTLISAGGLVALLIFNGSILSGILFESVGAVRYLSLMFTTFGVMAVQLAFRQYRLKSFVGLAEEKNELKIEGILKYVRHPIYTGLILITMGLFLFIPTIATVISCICILAYLPIGISLEEKKLMAAFGESYISYKKNVPALVPKILFRNEP